MRNRSPLSVAFGQIVRELRVEAGLSQERLSFLSKLSRNYVGQVERGENSPTLDLSHPTRRWMAAALVSAGRVH